MSSSGDVQKNGLIGPGGERLQKGVAALEVVTDQNVSIAERQPEQTFQPLGVGQAVFYDRESKLHPLICLLTLLL